MCCPLTYTACWVNLTWTNQPSQDVRGVAWKHHLQSYVHHWGQCPASPRLVPVHHCGQSLCTIAAGPCAPLQSVPVHHCGQCCLKQDLHFNHLHKGDAETETTCWETFTVTWPCGDFQKDSYFTAQCVCPQHGDQDVLNGFKQPRKYWTANSQPQRSLTVPYSFSHSTPPSFQDLLCKPLCSWTILLPQPPEGLNYGSAPVCMAKP